MCIQLNHIRSTKQIITFTNDSQIIIFLSKNQGTKNILIIILQVKTIHLHCTTIITIKLVTYL